jgi:hypothetical protein
MPTRDFKSYCQLKFKGRTLAGVAQVAEVSLADYATFCCFVMQITDDQFRALPPFSANEDMRANLILEDGRDVPVFLIRFDSDPEVSTITGSGQF